MKLFKTVPAYFMAVYFFYNYWDLGIKIQPVEKLSRRHFINSLDVSEVLGLTIYTVFWKKPFTEVNFIILFSLIYSLYCMYKDERELCSDLLNPFQNFGSQEFN